MEFKTTERLNLVSKCRNINIFVNIKSMQSGRPTVILAVKSECVQWHQINRIFARSIYQCDEIPNFQSFSAGKNITKKANSSFENANYFQTHYSKIVRHWHYHCSVNLCRKKSKKMLLTSPSEFACVWV